MVVMVVLLLLCSSISSLDYGKDRKEDKTAMIVEV
ncbi:hypothetical protein BVRB_5g111930 [Beta vulgaris subsp. vulgaris]|nr:hypothetical protein BVRB_5g111930 [Beta vulgaris subsp. vulgaris]